MEQTNRGFWNISDTARPNATLFYERWLRLCETLLPVYSDDSIWRYNRESKPQEPLQGWKLHISATILEACDLFEKVAPFLLLQDVQFKAPKSLQELSKINCGLQYGYPQVGKFITVYPSTSEKAVELAEKLHALTQEFVSISVPFDERYLTHSSVFFRYGAFEKLEMTDENGNNLPAVKNLSGELVYDDRFRAVPEWLENPFKAISKTDENISTETLLTTTYKVFNAITQRGKGGTYRALDISTHPFRLCIIKEGRRYGEVHSNGQDGYYLVKNECAVLKILGKTYKKVPQIYSSFEADGNFYLAMEFVEGKSLLALMKNRRRRFSLKQSIKYAVEISKIIAGIHQAGWIWNDCKPANLIVTKDKTLRPIDFENSYRITESAPFDWNTDGFSKPAKHQSTSEGDDIYALGAVVYFLLTGKFYNFDAPLSIRKFRRDVPKRFQETVERLLDDARKMSAAEVSKEFEDIFNSIDPNLKVWHMP